MTAGLTDDQIVDWLNRARDRSEPVTIGYRVPAGHAVYLRILHAAQNSGDGSYDDVSWQEVAQTTGRDLMPLSTSGDIWAPDLDLSPPSQWLSDKQCQALSATLNQQTSTPTQCTFLFHSSWANKPSGKGIITIWLPRIGLRRRAGSVQAGMQLLGRPGDVVASRHGLGRSHRDRRRGHLRRMQPRCRTGNPQPSADRGRASVALRSDAWAVRPQQIGLKLQ